MTHPASAPQPPAALTVPPGAPAQRHWEQVRVGDRLGPVAFPLSVYRLVVAAGAVRDFNSIHHNSEFARASGAPEMYANTMFLQGMWERTVRGYIGLAGTIRRLAGFRMNFFNCAGTTVVVHGEVLRTWRDGDTGLVEIKVWSENGGKVSVGPGTVTVTLPLTVQPR
jgi:acyl dehydratase